MMKKKFNAHKNVGENTKLLKLLVAVSAVILIALVIVFVFVRGEDDTEPEKEDDSWEEIEKTESEETDESEDAETEEDQETEETETDDETQVPEEGILPEFESDLVFKGKNNWLFYKTTVDGCPMEDFYGTNYFKESELENIKENLLEVRDKVEETGARFVLLVVPNKEVIYAEFMPDDVVRETEISRTDIVVEYLKKNTDLDIVYSKDAFMIEKRDAQLYYKTDSHWNMKGAYVALQEVLQELYGKSESIANITFEEHFDSYGGDLAGMIGMVDEYGIDTVYFLGEDQVKPEYTTEDSALLVGDSFAEFLYLEMQYYFKGGVTNGDIVPNGYNLAKTTFKHLEEADPDVVVWECCERHIERLGWNENK